MSAQSLTVRVGLLFDEKSLSGVERSLRNSGQRLSKVGTDLSLSLSLPLAAFGVTAVKAAGDIESLTLALESQLGTADAASKELDKLTEAAKNPGLGLEQAVRGSVRLQGVAFSADEARNVLVQMGNAIAATGGSAQELDNVTRQFAQMTSKGRVLQEDVSILSENMPGLAGLMQKAFGTQSVEAIRDMGVTGKEFVLQITKAAEGLPRVEGGIKNGIGNAIDSLKQSAAKVGLAINTAFDITGTIETLSSAVLALAQGFASLDPWAQKTILGIAGIAIATGPVIKAWGALKTFGSQMVGLWSSIVSVGTSLAAGIKTIATAFNALNLATRAFILIGVVTAVVSLVAAFNSYQSELSATEKAQASLAEVEKKAAGNIAGQKSEVDTLVNAYKQEGATLKQKQQILSELNRISPEYFGAIKVGKGDVEALTTATAKYSAELLRVAQITAAKERLVEIERAILDLNKTSEPSALQTFANIVLSSGNALQFASKQAGSYASNVNEAKEALNAERDALVGLVTKQTLVDASNGSLAKSYAAVSDESKKMAKTYREVTSDITNSTATAKLIGEDEDLAKIEALTNGIKKLVDAGFKPASTEVQKLKKELDSLAPDKVKIDTIAPLPFAAPNISAPQFSAPDPNAIVKPLTDITTFGQLASDTMERLNGGVITFGQAFESAAEKIGAQGSLMNNVILGMGDAISQAALSGETSFARLGQAAAGAAAKIVRAYIQQGVAAAVAKALSGLPFPLNLAAGAAAGGLAAALFTKAIGSIGVKGFARGTKNAPGGMALVGELGPELINLPRGSQVFPTPKTNQMLGGLGEPAIVGGTVKFDGRDLYLMIEKQQTLFQRTRGF